MTDTETNARSTKIAIVTGSNKGIGYGIVKGLCQQFNGIVYLTARDSAKGQEAVNKLKALGLNPKFHQLDITSEVSIDTFRDHIKETYGGIDILINNAGIYLTTSPPGEQAEQNVGVNYFGTLKVCQALFPLLRQNARVVNVSSAMAYLQKIPSKELQAKFKDPDLTIENLSKLMKDYIQTAKENRHITQGWGTSTYTVSKVGLAALTVVQQRMFNREKPFRNISINHVHPGLVKTDMNQIGKLSLEEGARSALFAALTTQELKGKYIWWDCSIVDWYGPLPS